MVIIISINNNFFTEHQNIRMKGIIMEMSITAINVKGEEIK